MKWLSGILMAFLTLACVTSFAQENGGLGAQPQKFDGGRFTIEPPAGWLHVSGFLSEGELAKLPANIREHYSRSSSDIIFMDIPSPDADKKGFKNSLNIVTIEEEVPLTEELVKELTSVLKQQYSGMFEDFELESSGVEKVGGMDALVFKGHYGVLNYAVKMEQILMPSRTYSLVLTCSYDSGDPKAEETAAACRKAFGSVQFSN